MMHVVSTHGVGNWNRKLRDYSEAIFLQQHGLSCNYSFVSACHDLEERSGRNAWRERKENTSLSLLAHI